MSGFLEFDLGNTEEAVKPPVTRFKVEDGRTYRLSLAWWPLEDDQPDLTGNPKFIKASRYYKQGLGYVIHDESIGTELKQLMGQNPRDCFATIVIEWKTSNDGTLDGSSFSAGKDFKVLPWIMSQEKLTTLLRVNRNFGMGEVDIQVTCPKGGAQYQKMEIMPINRSFKTVKHGNLFRFAAESNKKPLKEMAAVLNAEVARVAADLRDQIGRVYTIDQIKDKLGMGGGGTADVGAEDASQILDNIMPF